jgi:hypothetical protein
MTRLQTELARLYLPRSVPDGAGISNPHAWLDAQGRTRVLMLELCRPADGTMLSHIWRHVQADWEWPAPAMAVSGTDGLQLWFSLAEPVPVAEAVALLAGLRRLHVPGWGAHRVRQWPGQPELGELAPVPRCEAASGHWAAFVAADLMPLFEESPWLDIAPGDEGQAQLLAGMGSVRPAQWRAAMAQCVPAPASLPEARVSAVEVPAGGTTDPRQFLRRVMNDETVPMALRIEAAKALLPVTPSGDANGIS